MNNVSFNFVLSCSATSFGAYKAMFFFAIAFYYKMNASIFWLVEVGLDRAEICLAGHILTGQKWAMIEHKIVRPVNMTGDHAKLFWAPVYLVSFESGWNH